MGVHKNSEKRRIKKTEREREREKQEVYRQVKIDREKGKKGQNLEKRDKGK